MACTGPTGRSSLATVLPPVTPSPQTQVPAQDDTGQGCGDPRLSPGHRDAGRLVKLQLRASESWHHKTEGRLVPSLTLPPAGSRGALPVKGFSRHANIYKCLSSLLLRAASSAPPKQPYGDLGPSCCQSWGGVQAGSWSWRSGGRQASVGRTVVLTSTGPLRRPLGVALVFLVGWGRPPATGQDPWHGPRMCWLQGPQPVAPLGSPVLQAGTPTP